MKKAIYSILFILSIALFGCSEEAPPKPEVKHWQFETVESQRQTAIDNSGFNAQIYRNQFHPALVIKARGDSSITDTCPTGDGWATIDLLDAKTGTKTVELKCSTYSGSIACATTEDFKLRYTDGVCDTAIPMPLPHVVK